MRPIRPTGGGINGTGSTYAVAYGASSAYGTPPTITLPAPTEVLSADITNTTYAYLSMLNGQDFGAKQFGLFRLVQTDHQRL